MTKLRGVDRYIVNRFTRSYINKCCDRIGPITGAETEWCSPFISHTTPCFFVGSCFSQVIASKLIHMKFPAMSNPFGILFDPVSISNCLTRIAAEKLFDEHDIFTDQFQPDIYHSWNVHSSFSHTNPDLMLQTINKSLLSAREHIMKSDLLFITLGTATVHCLIDNPATVVANCHKRKCAYSDVPSNIFLC